MIYEKFAFTNPSAVNPFAVHFLIDIHYEHLGYNLTKATLFRDAFPLKLCI